MMAAIEPFSIPFSTRRMAKDVRMAGILDSNSGSTIAAREASSPSPASSETNAVMTPRSGSVPFMNVVSLMNEDGRGIAIATFFKAHCVRGIDVVDGECALDERAADVPGWVHGSRVGGLSRKETEDLTRSQKFKMSN